MVRHLSHHTVVRRHILTHGQMDNQDQQFRIYVWEIIMIQLSTPTTVPISFNLVLRNQQLQLVHPIQHLW